ncbi:MAG: phage major capsid protein [Proteobacteria bacterium]|nr:phage major capsid protein [Pseudomonadota bacterium]
MTYDEMVAKHGELTSQAENIAGMADTSGVTLTDEQIADQTAKINELMAEAGELETKIKAMKAKNDADAKVAAAKAFQDTPEPVPFTPDHPGATAADVPDGDIDVGEPGAVADGMGGFDHYDHFASAVRGAAVTSKTGAGMIDQRLTTRFEAAASGQNTMSGAEGGFEIPEQFSNDMYKRASTLIPGVLDSVQKISLTNNSISITAGVDHNRNGTTYRHGGVVAYWLAEAKEYTASTLESRKIDLKLNKLTALSYATEEELENTNNYGSRLLGAHSEALAEELTHSVMLGTGAGQPQGALVSQCVVSVAKGAGQAADTIITDNILGMWQALHSPSKNNAKWYYNGEAFKEIASMTLGDGTTTYLMFTPPGGIINAPHSSLMGKPAIESDLMEALGDLNDICLCDWSQYFLATKGTTKTAMSVHLRFLFDEVAYKSSIQVDGRPAWEESLRPRKGDSDRRVSPFITLAERA